MERNFNDTLPSKYDSAFSIALLCFAVPASAGETLANSVSAYHFNDATGSVSDIRFLPSGKRVVTAVCNSYLLMAHGEKM